MSGRKEGKHLIMALVYIVGWGCASGGLIFLNNHLLTEDGFHCHDDLVQHGVRRQCPLFSAPHP